MKTTNGDTLSGLLAYSHARTVWLRKMKNCLQTHLNRLHENFKLDPSIIEPNDENIVELIYCGKHDYESVKKARQELKYAFATIINEDNELEALCHGVEVLVIVKNLPKIDEEPVDFCV